MGSFAAVLLVVAWAGAAGAGLLAPTGEVVPGEYIAVLRKNATDGEHALLAQTVGARKMFRIGSSFKALHVKVGETQAKWLASRPEVEYVEHNQVVRAIGAGAKKAACPNLQREPVSWGQTRVTEASAEDVASVFAHDASWGTDVDAYVVDTGILCSHTEFTGRCVWGTNTAGGSNTDRNGHGTHVAGTIGGTTYGIAKKATVIAVKVLGDDGSGTNAGVIEGVEFTVTNSKTRKRASLANMSLGGFLSLALNNAVNAAVGEGVSFAVAAGNDNRNACYYSPASASEAVTVGSTELGSSGGRQVDARSYFSNFGSCLDIFAPGSSIVAAYIGSDRSFATLSGTSMASPHVAGAMAAYLGQHPDATPVQVRNWLMGQATEGLVNDVGNGSPNRLLHVQC